MLTLLTTIAMTVTPLSPMRPDTPPSFPIVVESLRSRNDIVAASRLVNWTQPPSDLVLPKLSNRAQVVAYIAHHYPTTLGEAKNVAMPWAWVLIDEHGVPGTVRLLKGSGHAVLDSLALSALRLARFSPALIDGKAVGLRTPIPIDVTYSIVGEQKPQDPDGPYFTPYTVKPEVLNRDEVKKALVREYPPELRGSGVSGTVQLWLFVDEEGRVVKQQVRQTSGHEQLDRAAIEVAKVIRFSPAKNRDAVVPVWIAIPVVFKAGL